MSEAKARSERIHGKISASQDRLQRGSAVTAPVPARTTLPDAYPPESYRSLAAEYPWLVVATGASLGLLAGAILPKQIGGKLGGRLLTAATLAAELGLSLAKQAAPGQQADGAAAAAQPAQPSSGTTRLRERAARTAGSARSTGLMLAGEAFKLVARARSK